MLGLRVGRGFQLVAAVAACGALASVALAQDMPPAAIPPAPSLQTGPVPAPQTAPEAQTAAVPPAATPAAAQAPAAQPLSQAQLDQLLAPIALYPDPLLSQVLMASTYPLEVVEEARWIREPANKSLTGDALTNALKQKNWDPSVMALAPVPSLLDLMADKLEWTEQLGNAFLAQQADVMSAVQRLRHQAMAAGNLKATPQCHCVIQTSGETISILPSDEERVCIPVYNPRVVYGGWYEPAYPPVEFPMPVGYAFQPDYPIGFYPAIEIAAFGPLWGWGSIDWSYNRIVIDNARFAAFGPNRAAFAGGVWVHDPAHRGGVAYSNPAVAARFGAGGAGRATLGGAGVAAGASLGHQAAFAPGAGVAGSAGRHGSAAFQAGGVARGSGAAHGGGGVGHAQFSPGPRGGPGGGPHGGGAGGGPHGGGGGGPHGGGGGGGGHHH
jgi:hypothetical protein